MAPQHRRQATTAPTRRSPRPFSRRKYATFGACSTNATKTMTTLFSPRQQQQQRANINTNTIRSTRPFKSSRSCRLNVATRQQRQQQHHPRETKANHRQQHKVRVQAVPTSKHRSSSSNSRINPKYATTISRTKRFTTFRILTFCVFFCFVAFLIVNKTKSISTKKNKYKKVNFRG